LRASPSISKWWRHEPLEALKQPVFGSKGKQGVNQVSPASNRARSFGREMMGLAPSLLARGRDAAGLTAGVIRKASAGRATDRYLPERGDA
jgi:hypothetical protein